MKRPWKTIFTSLVIAVLIASAAACGREKAPARRKGSRGNAETTAEGENPGAGLRFLLIGGGDGSWLSVKKGMADAAAELGVRAELLLPGDNLSGEEIPEGGAPEKFEAFKNAEGAARLKAFQDAAAAKPDGIALVLDDPEAWDEPVAAALSEGIPVIGIGKDDADNPRLFYIGQDEFRAAFLLTKKLVAEAKTKNVPFPQAHTAMAAANPETDLSQVRARGVRKALVESGLKSFEMFDAGEGDAESVQSAITAYIAAHPQTLFIMGADNATTERLAAAIKAAGKNPGDLFAGGFGASPVILEGIDLGYISASVDEQPYLQGYYAVYALRLYKNGGLVSNIDTGGFLVTAENADVIRRQSGTYR